MIKIAVMTMVACLLVLSPGAFADDGKDESGKGKQRLEEKYEPKKGKQREEQSKQRDGQSSYFHQHGQTRIPNGHMPPPGECRIWYPDRPAGHQPPPMKCSEARGRVEPGGWLISSGSQPQELKVEVYDRLRPGVVAEVGIFDALTGLIIRAMGAR